MNASGNFQFALYLRESGLSEQERSNLERIFSALLPERQVEIIDNWPKYLDKLLEIKHYADEERKRNIASAFDRIDKLLSDAELRAQESVRKAEERLKELNENRMGAEEYDRLKKLDAMKNFGRPAVPVPEETKPTHDPLADFM